VAPLLPLAGVPADKREEAMRRFAVLRPHIEGGATLTHAAAAAGVPLRTAQRWLAKYQRNGLAGLIRRPRSDRGQRHVHDELITLIEGLALRRPPPTVAWIHRQALDVAYREGWPPPTYATTHSIVTALDPALVTLAHDGDAAYRDAFELLHRHEADQSNGIWQADHTQLDLILVTDDRPWLTVILDDRSRGVAGYCVSLTAPSALHTSLALRQAIWRKPEADWGLCGIPDVLYVDHGSDFTSRHLEQVAADLHIQRIHSTVGRPQGRGKIERFFRTVNQLLLATLPGYTPQGRPVTAPRLSLSDLDQQLRGFMIDYNHRPHSETRQAPQDRWTAGGFVPRMPDSLEALDLLLVTVAKPRVVHRDGIRFQGQRYIDTALAGYVGEPVTIRYDPRDIAEIRVFHHDQLIATAISPELADRTVSLKDIVAARRQRRRQLRAEIDRRTGVVNQLLDAHRPAPLPGAPAPDTAAAPRLKRYRHE
jgi:putative transposase